MPTVCIQCALEAFVTSNGNVEKTREGSLFDETPEQHKARVHPNQVETQRRRRELEQEFARIMGGQMLYPDDN